MQARKQNYDVGVEVLGTLDACRFSYVYLIQIEPILFLGIPCYVTLRYFTLLYFTLLYFTLLYFTLLYFLLYFTLLYFTLLYVTLRYVMLC